MADISEMTKGELQQFAKETYDFDLDMRKSLENLLDDVKKLDVVKPKQEQEKKPLPSFLLNKSTNLWFPYTEALAARGDLAPCDENGQMI